MAVQFPSLPPELWVNIIQRCGAVECSKLSRVCQAFDTIVKSKALEKTWRRETYQAVDLRLKFSLLLDFLLAGGSDWRALLMSYQIARRSFIAQALALPNCAFPLLMQAKNVIDLLIRLEGYYFLDSEDWKEQIPILQKERGSLFEQSTNRELFLNLQRAHLEQPDDVDIRYYLSECYFRGIGVEMDATKAFEHASAAAQRDHPQGRCLLGIYFTLGIGCEPDTTEAFRYLDPPLTAQAKLFLALQIPELPAPDFVRVFHLIEEAAESGLAEAQHLAGNYYENGFGEEGFPAVTQTDPVKAFNFYKASANQGRLESLDQLGEYFLEGVGTSKDFFKGFACIKLSSRYGSNRYCSTEGFMAIEDPENRRKMWRFLKKGAERNGINSRMALWSIKKQLSEAETQFLNS